MSKGLRLGPEDLDDIPDLPPPRLRDVAQRFPRPSHQRIVREVYRAAWQEVLCVLCDMRYPEHEDGNVGFCFPDGEQVWFVTETQLFHPCIMLAWSTPGSDDWQALGATRRMCACASCNGLEDEALRRVMTHTLGERILEAEEDLEERYGPPLRWYDVADFLAPELRRAVEARIDIDAVLAEIEARFPLDPVVLARWARLREQFQIERERIFVDEYNALIATSGFLDALEEIEPGLLWLGWLLVSGAGNEVETTQPVAWMRKSLGEAGLGRAFWRTLVKRDPVEFSCVYAMHDVQSLKPLVGHWQREQWIGQPVPQQGPVFDWMQRFRLSNDTSKLVSFADLEMNRGLALAIAREGVRLLQTETFNIATFEAFEQTQLPTVLAWIDATAPNVGDHLRHRGWSSLLRRTHNWESEQQARRAQDSPAWSCVITEPFAFEGYQLTPLLDAYALWREGVLMHHCIGTYSAQCASGTTLALHVEPPEGSRGYTLALAGTYDGGWRCLDIRGVANRYPDKPVQDWVARLCAWLDETRPDAPRPTDDDEDDENVCPICREDYCGAHLVANQDNGWPGITGEIHSLWDDAYGQALGILCDAYLRGRSHTQAGSELNAMLELIQRDGRDRTEEGFDEACANLGIDLKVEALLLELLCRLPGVVENYYQTDGMPGMSSSGYNYFTENPEAIVLAWHASVLRYLQPGAKL